MLLLAGLAGLAASGTPHAGPLDFNGLGHRALTGQRSVGLRGAPVEDAAGVVGGIFLGDLARLGRVVQACTSAGPPGFAGAGDLDLATVDAVGFDLVGGVDPVATGARTVRLVHFDGERVVRTGLHAFTDPLAPGYVAGSMHGGDRPGRPRPLGADRLGMGPVEAFERGFGRSATLLEPAWARRHAGAEPAP